MKQRRGVFAFFVSIGLVSSIGLFAQNKDDKKRDDAQKKEIQNIVKFVDAAAAGQPAANDLFAPAAALTPLGSAYVAYPGTCTE